MNQPLVLDQGGHVGATLHFQRHILYWKRWTIFQFFFLILSTLLGVCYISENNYRINGDYVPIIVGAQNLIQIVVYLRWRWAMKNKNNLIDCARYLNQQQMVNQGWLEEVDMHYCISYTPKQRLQVYNLLD
ncbi:unnamed protein product (macronuclear) [Paramecium tetraurelia]|uniref:Uncharacterized protein n=1 Tax=Paramecium tetraurelia TaxID=5888 RepID=A0E9M5_PARTE|nr:uncharacterized protein GSPATT00024723001 [Paramecium tetraurelia]CAK91992.1 unnamed protein product [Paramecium tetraurelia]|eukprot:XP_001459389.1 hypothetical protein (macronuclear) [Paramecium tetraurelia strain d4-2]